VYGIIRKVVNMSITENDIDRLYNLLDKLKSKQYKNDTDEEEIISLKKAILVLENNY
jgi:hypothetical protein